MTSCLDGALIPAPIFWTQPAPVPLATVTMFANECPCKFGSGLHRLQSIQSNR